MPRQYTHHSRIVYAFPDDFPQRLKRFQQASGLPWAELKRRLDTDPETIRGAGGIRESGPARRHYAALLVVADSMGLGHLFTDQGRRREVHDGRSRQTRKAPIHGRTGGRPPPLRR